MQLSPQTIRSLCRESDYERPLISPFKERHVHGLTGLSGGLSCAGYDISLKGIQTVMRDGRSPRFLMPFKTQSKHGKLIWTIPPHTGVLGVSAERFCLPNNIVMHYFNKSTIARMFLNAAATLAEPGWCGYLTLELFNSTDVPFDLYQDQPIGQVAFMQMDSASDAPYNGKYQNQPDSPIQALKERYDTTGFK